MARFPQGEYARRSIPREAAAWDVRKDGSTSGSTVVTPSTDAGPVPIPRLRCVAPAATFAAIPTGNPSPIDGLTLANGDLVAYDNGTSLWSGFWTVNLTGDWTRYLPTYHRRGQLFTVWDTTALIVRAQLWIVEINTETFVEGVTNVYIHREPHDDKGTWTLPGPAAVAAIVPGGYAWLLFPVPVGVASEYVTLTTVNYYQVSIAGKWTIRISIKQSIFETLMLGAQAALYPKVEFNIHKIPAVTVLPIAPAIGTVYIAWSDIDQLASPFQHDVRWEGEVNVDLAIGDRIAISMSNVAGWAPFITPTVTNSKLEMSLGPQM